MRKIDFLICNEPDKSSFYLTEANFTRQKPLTLPEHLSSPPVFSGVRGTRSLVIPPRKSKLFTGEERRIPFIFDDFHFVPFQSYWT